MTDAEQILAGTRDASWYGRPRHDHGRASTWTPRYHVAAEGDHEHEPVCMKGAVLLSDERIAAADVDPPQRCNRGACRAMFAVADAERAAERLAGDDRRP